MTTKKTTYLLHIFTYGEWRNSITYTTRRKAQKAMTKAAEYMIDDMRLQEDALRQHASSESIQLWDPATEEDVIRINIEEQTPNHHGLWD